MMKKESAARKSRRWLPLVSGIVLVTVAALAWFQVTAERTGKFAAYADGHRPSLVFLYTTEPHRMPDGSMMY